MGAGVGSLNQMGSSGQGVGFNQMGMSGINGII
jgi:hypothetical protein